jgi:hypothetical protein
VEYIEFVKQVTQDLQENGDYSEVKKEGEYRLYVERGAVNVSVPLYSWYQEYLTEGYQESFKNYKQLIEDILNLHRFKLDTNNVYPFIGKSFKDCDEYVSEDLFCDLRLYWVSDIGEVFRYVSIEDVENVGIDIATLKAKSFENLNKMVNLLVRIEKTFEIYTLRFVTEYAATLFLSENIQKQIKSKIGDDILFCMPSSSSLVCAKYCKSTYRTYTQILKHIVAIDNDVNKISDYIYRRSRNGEYSIIA